jgi:hypothetical protein
MKYAVVENGTVVRITDANTPYEIPNATLVFGPIDSDGTYEHAVFTQVPSTLPNTALMQAASDSMVLDQMRSEMFAEEIKQLLSIGG